MPSSFNLAPTQVGPRSAPASPLGAKVTQTVYTLPPPPAPTEYTTPGTQTVDASFWGSASTVTIECIAAGGSARVSESGGGGGAYSKRNTYPLSGLTGLYLSIPAMTSGLASGANAFVKANSNAGAILCEAFGGAQGNAAGGSAAAGGAAASGTGDVKYSGGTGANGSISGGGGAAGSTGNGGASPGGQNISGGTAGGSPAGAGGTGADNSTNGANYGGGGGAGPVQRNGAQGWIKLTWA